MRAVAAFEFRSRGGTLFLEKLTRCSLFNYIAQPHKLIYAVIWPHVTPTFNIVHRRGTDRAHNYLALIEHRELNDHPDRSHNPGPRLSAPRVASQRGLFHNLRCPNLI
jgi:hypothetical protein